MYFHLTGSVHTWESDIVFYGLYFIRWVLVLQIYLYHILMLLLLLFPQKTWTWTPPSSWTPATSHCCRADLWPLSVLSYFNLFYKGSCFLICPNLSLKVEAVSRTHPQRQHNKPFIIILFFLKTAAHFPRPFLDILSCFVRQNYVSISVTSWAFIM